jgi:RIO kinase 1
VLDKSDVIKEYNKKGYHFIDPIEVRSGKEATVFEAQGTDKIYALKIYTDLEMRSFKHTEDYLEGKFVKSHSLKRGISRGSSFAKKAVHENWVKREYVLLKKLYELGAGVPAVYDWTATSILMDFIGDKNNPAPRLVDVTISKDVAKKYFHSVLHFITIALEAGIVHSDLSAYNILVWEDEIFIIDLPQAVDIRQSPNVEKLLRRDIDNVVSYFKKYIEIDTEEIYASFGL